MTRLSKNPIDAYVGAQIKQRRTTVGMSQTVLANKLGITFQQVQKYEKGANRVGSSRLYEISEILNVPIQSFFEGVEDVIAGDNVKTADVRTKDSTLAKFETFISSPSGVDMIKAFVEINDPAVRKQITSLVKSVSSAPQEA